MNLRLSSLCVLAAVATLCLRADPTLTKDIEYGKADGQSLRLDACVPDGKGPFPVAILIHGGGWSSGDKSGSNKPGDGADITPWFAPLSAAHFTWFSINYRLAPAHPWPAGFEDVETAVRWVKAHAVEYKGDPNRIAVFGHSAGGHLATYLGTNGADDTHVQAIVGCAAVTDLVADTERRHGPSKSLQALFGLPADYNAEAKAKLEVASPVYHVHKGMPPFLLLQGSADRTVAPQMAVDFQKAVQGVGGTAELIPIEGAPHRLLDWAKFDPDFMKKVTEWLEKTMPAGS